MTAQVCPAVCTQDDAVIQYLHTVDKLTVTNMYKMQVANKLHGQRFRLQECVTKVQECMNSLEKEHAWEDHTTHLASLLDHMRTLVQASILLQLNAWAKQSLAAASFSIKM